MSDEKRTATGTCLCGAVRFELTMPSRFCAHCHCNNCRRAHGAAFVTWAGFQETQLTMLAGKDALTRYATDTGAARSFCAQCGSTLFYRSSRWAGEVHVALANVHGEIDRAPSGHVYVDHGAAWYTITDDLPRYGGEDGTEPKRD